MTPNLLIKGGTLVDPTDSTLRKADVLIKAGAIEAVGSDIPADDTPVYDASNRHVSPGWMDMHVHLREPGYEYKETIASGCEAAAFGGFTAVACMPNTDPPIHTRDVVEYVIERARDTAVDVYPIGCVSRDRRGERLTDMSDLVQGGAVAFSDDGSPVHSAGLMRRALEYASMLDRPIVNHMEDLSLNEHGHMHEGLVSTRLGLPGIPAPAEEVMIARDIILAHYTGGHVHVAHISTRRGVELVRRAKSEGIPVTAEVCTHHFTLTDAAVERTDFSTDTKMHPPLRSEDDVQAIKEGLADGTIDAICTDHAPHASFEKEVEFTAAPFGIIGLESAWGLVVRELVKPGVLSLQEAIYKLIVAPRRIFRIDVPRIEAGASANLTIFDLTTDWVFTEAHIRSKSHNTPFIGESLKGRAWAIYNRGRFVQV